MRTRLRQVALVAKDLEPVERAITDELGVELCFRDPGVAEFGLHNALFPIGDKLLEVVAPTTEGTTAGRLLDKRKGDGGYMVILETDGLDEWQQRFADRGVRVVYTAKGPGITGLHLHPRDVGGAILSVDATDRWGEWPWAGPEWRDHVRTERVTDLTGVEIQAEDPAAMAARWGDILGRAVEPGADGADEIALDEGVLRFVTATDGRGDGLSGLSLAAAPGEAPRRVEIGGVRVDIV